MAYVKVLSIVSVPVDDGIEISEIVFEIKPFLRKPKTVTLYRKMLGMGFYDASGALVYKASDWMAVKMMCAIADFNEQTDMLKDGVDVATVADFLAKSRVQP